MKNVKRVLIAITILTSSALMTSCFDQSEEVFGLEETGNNSGTDNDSNDDQWN